MDIATQMDLGSYMETEPELAAAGAAAAGAASAARPLARSASGLDSSSAPSGKARRGERGAAAGAPAQAGPVPPLLQPRRRAAVQLGIGMWGIAFNPTSSSLSISK